MVEMVVSAEQAKLLAEAQDSVEIVDAHGNRLGFFARRFSDRDIEIARGRVAARHALGESAGRLDDARRDRLDAVICGLQAAHAAALPDYGLPAALDPLEGWIASVPETGGGRQPMSIS